jgi:hypothetical protein
MAATNSPCATAKTVSTERRGVYIETSKNDDPREGRWAVWLGSARAEGSAFIPYPIFHERRVPSALPAPEQTDKIYGLLPGGNWFYSFVIDHEIPFAYGRPLCAKRGQPENAFGPRHLSLCLVARIFGFAAVLE